MFFFVLQPFEKIKVKGFTRKQLFNMNLQGIVLQMLRSYTKFHEVFHKVAQRMRLVLCHENNQEPSACAENGKGSPPFL